MTSTYIQTITKENFNQSIQINQLLEQSFFYASDNFNLNWLPKLDSEYQSIICCNTNLIKESEPVLSDFIPPNYKILYSRLISVNELNQNLKDNYYSNTFHHAQWIILKHNENCPSYGYKQLSILLISGDYGIIYQELFYKNKTKARAVFVDENNQLNFSKYVYLTPLSQNPFVKIILDNPNGKPLLYIYESFDQLINFGNKDQFLDTTSNRAPLPKNDGYINISDFDTIILESFNKENFKYNISKTFSGEIKNIINLFKVYFEHPFFKWKIIEN